MSFVAVVSSQLVMRRLERGGMNEHVLHTYAIDSGLQVHDRRVTGGSSCGWMQAWMKRFRVREAGPLCRWLPGWLHVPWRCVAPTWCGAAHVVILDVHIAGRQLLQAAQEKGMEVPSLMGDSARSALWCSAPSMPGMTPCRTTRGENRTRHCASALLALPIGRP